MSDDTPAAPVFILAPPLGLGAHLAACLGRHPSFASLPAIQLMCADSPADLTRRWGERLQGHDHGLIRAVAVLMEGGEDAAAVDRAAAWIEARANMPSGAVFAALASAARPRRLIDASFLYAVDDAALDRIPRLCPEARFVHLLRHPSRVLGTPEAAQGRGEALWLRPHLRIHAFLAEQPVDAWVRLRAEWLATDPRPRLAALLDWLGATRDASALDGLLDAGRAPGFARPGRTRARHGVDPALTADPGLQALFGAPPAPDLDDAGWEAAGFDAETRAMARLFGYV